MGFVYTPAFRSFYEGEIDPLPARSELEAALVQVRVRGAWLAALRSAVRSASGWAWTCWTAR